MTYYDLLWQHAILDTSDLWDIWPERWRDTKKYILTNTIWQIQFEKCILRDSWPFGQRQRQRQSQRLVAFETLITILEIEKLNSWRSLLPDNDKDKDKDKDIWDIRDTSDNSNNYWQFWKISTFLTLILTVDSDNWQSRHLLILTLKGDPRELWPLRLLVTFDQIDEDTWLLRSDPTYLPTYLLTYLPTLRHKTCDIWDTDYNSGNWEPKFMTIFVICQSRVTLNSIRNSCDVCIFMCPKDKT